MDREPFHSSRRELSSRQHRGQPLPRSLPQFCKPLLHCPWAGKGQCFAVEGEEGTPFTHILLSSTPLHAKYRRNEVSTLLPNAMRARIRKNRPSSLILSKSSLTPGNVWPPPPPHPHSFERQVGAKVRPADQGGDCALGNPVPYGWGGVRWGRRKVSVFRLPRPKTLCWVPSKGVQCGEDMTSKNRSRDQGDLGSPPSSPCPENRGHAAGVWPPLHCPLELTRYPLASCDPGLLHPGESQSPAKVGS